MKLKKVYFARVRVDEHTDMRDMLRYDLAFQSQSDKTLIAFPVFRTKSGDLGGHVTEARWRSFGLRVNIITDAALIDAVKFSLNAGEFRTWQHIPPDYRTLVPFTLGQYLQAKDLQELEKNYAKSNA